MSISFEWAYAGTPPWDIGRAQDAFVRLEEAGRIVGSVLDVGCGTGENAFDMAAHGHETWGIDSAPTAIQKALEKAEIRGIPVTFKVFDALRLKELGRTFDTAIDSGLFHCFDDDDRPVYARSIRSAVRSGGLYHLMCFSEDEPLEGGPRRVTRAEIRETFKDGWTVESIEANRFATRIHAEGARAWLATLRRD